MMKIFKIKDWQIFLILFLIPLLIHLNLPFLTETLIPSALFMLIWTWMISIWLFKFVDYFKTDYLDKFEIKLFNLNLILINLIFIVIVPILLIMFYKKEHSSEVVVEILSKIDDYIRIYIYIAIIAILVTASRIHTAKRLQRNLNINDYFKSAILFIFLPLGIFWIQNEIIGILKNEKSDNKNKGYTLIVVSVLLIIITIFNFKNAEFKTSSQNQNAKSFIIDSFLIEETRQQNDSFFYSMDDSSKADYIFKAGIQFCERGIYRAAINNFNYSIQFDSSKSDYYFNRGLILYQQFNQFDSAIIDLTRTIELDPSDWRAYQIRGNCNYILGNHKKGLLDINKVIDLKADFSNAYLLRGMLKAKLNDKVGACIDLNKADSLGNGDALLKIMEICN